MVRLFRGLFGRIERMEYQRPEIKLPLRDNVNMQRIYGICKCS